MPRDITAVLTLAKGKRDNSTPRGGSSRQLCRHSRSLPLSPISFFRWNADIFFIAIEKVQRMYKGKT
jgi:hypothetical protein